MSPDFIFDMLIKNGVWCKYLVLLSWVYYCWLLLYPDVVRIFLFSYVFWKLALFLPSYWNFFFSTLGLPSHIEPSLNRRKNRACPFTKFQTLGMSFNFHKIFKYIFMCIYIHIYFKYPCIYMYIHMQSVFLEMIEYEYLLLIYLIVFSRLLKYLFLSAKHNWGKSL